MKITLIELRNIYLQLNKKILSVFEKIEISSDYYWCTATDERENLANKPTLCLGSLWDDWFELKKVTQREFASLVDAQRFGNILISIGEAIKQKNDLEIAHIVLEQETFSTLDDSVLTISARELGNIYPYIEATISLFANNEINLAYDLYLTTLPNEREKIDIEPTLSTGSLKNDWGELKKLLHKKEATVEDLDRFANVLIAISETVFHKAH